MTSSGTTAYNPSIGELVLFSYNIIGLRSTSLLQEHFEYARMATNMLLANWANQGVNLWKVDLVTTPLVQGQSTYNVDPNTVVVLDAYMEIDNGNGQPIDRIILPISRSEWASYPSKNQQGFTTVFWFDRLLSPTITLWPVPDGVSAQFLKYYRVTQIQDAAFTSGQTLDIPYLWLEAFCDALSYRLAKAWAPEKAAPLKAVADETYKIAALQNIETAQQYITPQLENYYRP